MAYTVTEVEAPEATFASALQTKLNSLSIGTLDELCDIFIVYRSLARVKAIIVYVAGA